MAKGHVPVVYFCAMLFSPTGQFCLCLNRNLGLLVEAGGPLVIQGAKNNGSFSYYPGYLLAYEIVTSQVYFSAGQSNRPAVVYELQLFKVVTILIHQLIVHHFLLCSFSCCMA